MKRKILITAITVLVQFNYLSSQITVSSANYYAIGYKEYDAVDTLPATSIVPGSTGTNITWNFSALHTDKYDTLSFVNPSTTPYGTSYPSANIAAKVGFSYEYFDKNTSGFYIDGVSGVMSDPAHDVLLEHFNPHAMDFQFPSSYGTSYTSNYTVTGRSAYTGTAGYDSMRIKQVVLSNSIIDAWGSLQTPFGINSCLRQKSTKTGTDSTWIHSISPPTWIFLGQQKDTTITYSWWANIGGTGISLCSFDVKPSTNAVGTVTWLYSIPTMGIEEWSNNSEINIFPNPTRNEFKVTSSKFKVKNVSIYNVMGEEILSFDKLRMTENESYTIDVSSYAKGVYFVEVQTDGSAGSPQGSVLRKKLIKE